MPINLRYLIPLSLFLLLSLNLIAQQNCNNTIHTGEGTFYGGVAGSSGGNCSLPVDAGDFMHCAMNHIDYDGSNACGACLEVTGADGSVVVKVVDRCPECAQGDVDLTQQAFDIIGNPIDGRIPISWKYVPCPLNNQIKINFKEENIYYTAIQFRDIKHAVSSMEYRENVNDPWITVNRVNYNFFVKSSLINYPIDVRVTSILGERLIFSNINQAHPSVEFNTQQQFSTPNCNPTPPTTYFNGANGLYTITTQNSDKNLKPTSGINVGVANVNVGDQTQQWEINRITGISNPVYTIKSRSTGRYLEVPFARCNANGSNRVGTWTNANGNHKKWIIDNIGNNMARLRPYHCSGKALTSRANNPSNIIITNNATGAPGSKAEHRFYIRTVPSNARGIVTEDLEEEEMDLNFGVNVYPNPVINNQFNVALSLSEENRTTTVVVYDLLGAVIYRKAYESLPEGLSNISVDLQGVAISNGIYLLKVRHGEKERMKTISILK